ncbi:major facilitator superfamily domain-containing protein [Zalerion maritima]|uniref:Major facilitator superfamily domain-containing protein n=1 Tax=Zalerion maritima TaxID=339359 RepID=A0AAD5RQ65_9PEZI|nr:major facilitator superfamily domain-containing protein [Zalerion maritima]
MASSSPVDLITTTKPRQRGSSRPPPQRQQHHAESSSSSSPPPPPLPSSSSSSPSLPHRILAVLSPLHAPLSIFLLFANYFLAQYDKFVLSYFRPSILRDLAITDPQYALLSGYSTGIVYALLALPLAFLADHARARVWTLSAASSWWSLCVIFQGLASTFPELYCARLGMGIGQSAVEALSVSLISDLVRWSDVFVGNSVFYVGVYVGEAVSGNIASVFRETGQSWRVALRAIGITGLVVGMLVRVVIREPERRKGLVALVKEGSQRVGGGDGDGEGEGAVDLLGVRYGRPAVEGEDERVGDGGDGHDGCLEPGAVMDTTGNDDKPRSTTRAAPPRQQLLGGWKLAREEIKQTLDYLVRMRSFWALLLSSSCRLLAGNVFGYYMPGYLGGLYPNTTTLFSRYGIIVGVVGSFSVLLGGVLSSVFWKHTKLMPLFLTAGGGMISSVFVMLMIFSNEVENGNEDEGVKVLYGVMVGAYLTAEMWLGCFFAFVALLLPPRFKTFGLAIWGSVQVLVYSSGPEIMGLALKDVESGTDEYETVTRVALGTIITVGYWGCGLGLLASVGLVRRDLRGEFVGGELGWGRKWAFLGFGIGVVAMVVTLFVFSLVYGV